jgi:hypothetical protein
LPREKKQRKKRGEYNREEAKRMRTGRQEKMATGENNNVSREGQFRLFHAWRDTRDYIES